MPISDALHDVRALAARLEKQLRGWLAQSGRTAPRAACQLARLGLALAKKLAEDVEVAFSTPSTDLVSIIALNRRAQRAERFLHDLLERSTHESLHPVLSPTVRVELQKLGIKGQVLVSGTPEISYELRTLEPREFSKLVRDNDLDDFEWPFFIFRVPNSPLDWPLHHVLLYHEIGHALRALRGGPAVAVIPAELQADAEMMKTNPSEAAKRVVLMRTFHESSSAWFDELYADAVGLLLAGPTYALAFSRLLGGFLPLDAASDTHPPLALRIQLLASSLAALGFDSVMVDPLAAPVRKWFEMAQGVKAYTAKAPVKHVLVQLEKAARDNHEEILRLAIQHVAEHAYAPVDFARDAKRAVVLREWQIPPIEESDLPTLAGCATPLSPARIFNITWHAFLEESHSQHPAPAIPEHYGNMLLGALDGAEALRIWSR